MNDSQHHHDSPSDESIRERLEHISREPLSTDTKTVRTELDHLDQLAEQMVGRRESAENTLKAEIQDEVLRRGPDRTITADGTADAG